jgi:hypothetical protein
MQLLSSVTIIALFMLSACNETTKSPHSNHHRTVIDPIVVPLDSEIEGQYLAVFETINPELSQKVSGAFTFSVEKEIDELVMDVRLTNSGTNIIHAQNIRLANRCPTLEDDTNLDGVIDAFEGEAVYGKIFIPLDGDISTQSSHDGEFPTSDTYGNYIYAKLTTFSKFMEELRKAPEVNEEYIKLKDQEPLNIEKRVVVIQGMSEDINLPSTVRSIGQMTAHQSIPIVCGSIRKVLLPPGELDF